MVPCCARKPVTTIARYPTAASAGPSDIQVGDIERVLLDEVAAGLDEIAHQGREGFLGEVGMADADLKQRADFRVERGLPQLVGIHFAEAFVAGYLDAA